LTKERIHKGIPVSPGISIAKAYVYSRKQIKISPQAITPEQIEKETQNLETAIERSKYELNKVYNLSKEKIGEENSKIFDAQMQILNDRLFFDDIINRISSEHKTAATLIHIESMKMESALSSAKDTYMRERISDFTDVMNRILRNMKNERLVSKVDEKSIIVAHDLTPADTILFSKRKVQGYATDTGGTTSHAAIISRALRVPAVVGMINISKNVIHGSTIIIDGFDGLVITNPEEDTITRFNDKYNEYLKHEKDLEEVIYLPCETQDGKHINLTTNVEFDEEIEFVKYKDRCGIGLYRTEHLFFEKGTFPSLSEQVQEYSYISEVAYPEKVTIRTFDIGGDKILDKSEKENNPFLGWRGIRICLDRKNIFKEQLAAMLMASNKKNVKIMFPMITSVNEVREAKQLLQECKSELEKRGYPFDREIQVGIMIEVPSAVMIAEDLAKEVDFFSIGTNDLIQYILAVDRGNSKISKMFQEFHPAVLRAIRDVVIAGHRNNIPVSVCGEMASIPKASFILIGLGIDELSVVPSIYPQIKQIIRAINYEEVKNFADSLLGECCETIIKEKVNEYYKNRILKIINNK
jgi:phosphotransferase system enzyme I (PtsI)